MSDVSRLDEARFRFEGIDVAERAVMRFGTSEDAGSILIRDRTDRLRRGDEFIGRLQLTKAAIDVYRDERAALGDAAVGEDGVPGEPHPVGTTAAGDLAPEQPAPRRKDARAGASEERLFIAEAACEWMRWRMLDSTVGSPISRYRIEIRSSGKQERNLWNGTVTCSDSDCVAVVGPSGAAAATAADGDFGKMPEAQWPQSSERGVLMWAGPMQVMMAMATSLSRLAIAQSVQLQGIHGRILTQVQAQLRDSQAQTERLLAQNLQREKETSTDNLAERIAAGDRAVRETLGKDAIGIFKQLGQIGMLFVGKKMGLSEAELKVFGELSTDEEFLKLVADPNVQAMLRDPKTRPEVFSTLKDAAAAMKAAQPENKEGANASGAAAGTGSAAGQQRAA